MKRIALTLTAALLLSAACTKDNGTAGTDRAKGLTLLTEKLATHGTKTVVDGYTVQWVDGDKVWLNGNEGTVAIAGTDARVAEDIDFGSADIYGYYPCTLAPAADAQSPNPTVTLAGQYTAAYDGSGRQRIDLPMVAHAAAGAQSLEFRHVSAAVRVRIRNNFSHPIAIDSVVVASPTHQLCGSTALDLTAADLGLAARTTATASLRRVGVGFHTEVLVAPGAVCEVQVPILPIDEGSLTLRILARRTVVGMACDAATYTYERTDAAGALARNQMATAQIALGNANLNLTTVERGAFTINGEGDQVFFSKGNLRYTIADGTWSFMEHQYDIGESGTVGENYAGETSVSLFGWGTGGATLDGSITSPTATGTGTDYGPASGDLTQALDWGHNPIANGGNTADQWRTLSNTEWNYILRTRKASTVDGKANARYAPATVAGEKGMIIFPDQYTHPSISVLSGSFSSAINISASSLTFTKVSVDQANWEKMEAAGAVFLPTAGQRVEQACSNPDNCYYWTKTQTSATQAYSVSICASTLSCYINQNRNVGCAVRLVQDVK